MQEISHRRHGDNQRRALKTLIYSASFGALGVIASAPE
jgi:hypothetical protein